LGWVTSLLYLFMTTSLREAGEAAKALARVRWTAWGFVGRIGESKNRGGRK
jgi:hypothetical protein